MRFSNHIIISIFIILFCTLVSAEGEGLNEVFIGSEEKTLAKEPLEIEQVAEDPNENVKIVPVGFEEGIDSEYDGNGDFEIVKDGKKYTVKDQLTKILEDHGSGKQELKDIVIRVVEGEPIYDIIAIRHVKILLIFPKDMQINIIVEPKDGSIIKEYKPWWHFWAA